MDYFSPSSMRSFSVNPILFRIKYLNRDVIDSTHSPVFMLGSAFHLAMEVYYGGSDEYVVSNESEAIQFGLQAGLEFIEKYPDGMIGWNTTYQNKQQVMDKFSFAFNSYVKEMPYRTDNIMMIEDGLHEKIDVEWKGQKIKLPVALKGYPDRVDTTDDGELEIIDYKTVSAFSREDKIDAAKILQAVVYYFLVYAQTGRMPVRTVYEEVKVSKNRDGSPQVRRYDFNYAENELFFDFFFRFYQDMIRAINGEMVWIPNIDAMFDNEIALIAYINRLDEPEEVAKQMKEQQTDNITDLLRSKVASASNMNKLMSTIEQQFISGKTLNYKDMTIEQRIESKMAEHGMLVKHVDTVAGATVDLFRFEPSVGIKMTRIKSYAADIEQVTGKSGVRILAPIPNTTYIGFEIPKTDRVFHSNAPKATGLKVPVGIDIFGETQLLDISDAPHVLIAGTTGGGKSVMLNSILESVKGNAEFWLGDPKGVELMGIESERFAEEPEEIRSMLEDLVEEMDARYAQMKTKGLKKYDGTPIICVIDEFGDFILENPGGLRIPAYDNWTQGRLYREFLKQNPQLTPEQKEEAEEYSKDTLVNILDQAAQSKVSKYMEYSGEDLVVKLAQKARAAAIHLIIATQRPSVDVVTGRIKANFPTRIALRTAAEVESRIILDQPGAEKLQGKGDALILRSDSAELTRVQGFSV